MIPVTKPFLPPQEAYQKYLDGIWQRQWLTNMGPLANDLELKLKSHLGVKHLLFVTNGTVALQMAIKALDLKGEIITTPFSFVATTSCIVWEGCTPVFVDIDPEMLTIDETKIEAAITPKTTAILATHVFGNPCNVEAIAAIAKKHNLKVIYDAAHCFGSKYKGRSLLSFGDISTGSFHATKLFHTIEGGCLVTNNNEIADTLAAKRDHGFIHKQSETFGTNARQSEFHAAMGICNLQFIESILSKRKEDALLYFSKLENTSLSFLVVKEHEEYNHAYFLLFFLMKQHY